MLITERIDPWPPRKARTCLSRSPTAQASSPWRACARAGCRSTPRRSTSPTRNSADRWRELLDGAGVKRAAISGRGLFKDAASDALIRQTFFDGAVTNFQIVIPDFGSVTGLFQITSLDLAGEHNGEVTYELALELAGALTFAAM